MSKTSFTIGDGNAKSGLSALPRPVEIGFDAPLFVVAGPCVIESEDICLDIAKRLVEIGKDTISRVWQKFY